MDKRIPKLIDLFKQEGEYLVYSETNVYSFAHTVATKEYRAERYNKTGNTQEDIYSSDKEHEVINVLLKTLAGLRLKREGVL